MDGTVVAVGNNSKGRCSVSDWTDIVAVSAGDFNTVGLKADGTVAIVGSGWVYTGYDKGDLADFTGVIAISVGYDQIIGLNSNGTVVAVGSLEYGQCHVSDWSHIKLP